jgi:hypothetical protein
MPVSCVAPVKPMWFGAQWVRLVAFVCAAHLFVQIGASSGRCCCCSA